MGPFESSPESEIGDERAGDDKDSSKSETKPPSRDAAKLLEISGSDTTAKDDWVEAVDVVDVVLSLAEKCVARASSCHIEWVTSMLPYKRPYTDQSEK